MSIYYASVWQICGIKAPATEALPYLSSAKLLVRDCVLLCGVLMAWIICSLGTCHGLNNHQDILIEWLRKETYLNHYDNA